MTRLHYSPLVAAALMISCGPRTPEQQFVEAAATALGGRDRVSAITTVVMEGQATAGNLGQDMTWEATGQQFNLSEYRRSVDALGRRARTEQTRTPAFLYFQGPQPVRQVSGVDDDIAYAVGAKGNATRASAAAARDRRLEVYHHPLTIVRAMLEPSTTIANLRDEGDGRAADVTIGDATLVLEVDGRGLPTAVSSQTTHPNLGDVTIETRFSDYQSVDGLNAPMRLTTLTDRHTTGEIRLTRYTFGGPADLAAPPDAAATQPSPPPAPRVDATDVAKGIWWLAGQTHHSALVEFADHLMLIEAPQSEARTLAVIAKARELVPGKPLTQLVTSHHHFDHTAGMRAAIAEGMTIITHKANAAFVEEIARRPFTRQPDSLQKNPKAVDVRTVDDALTLEDAAMTVELYPISGNPHGDTLLMAYLPRERVLVEADAFSPGGTYHPYAQNLIENIQKRKLRVDRVVPLHGTIMSFADVVKAAAP
jgi:glyoxylase-like metal-dependent hydrolase (beta-lactamase superfamily II)